MDSERTNFSHTRRSISAVSPSVYLLPEMIQRRCDARGQSASLRAIASNQKGQSAKGFLKRRKEGALHCRRLIPRNEAVAERKRERERAARKNRKGKGRRRRMEGGGEDASAEWRTDGASGRCLEQSWLMRALQLAAPHNGIKEGGQRWAPPLSPTIPPSLAANG